MPSTTLQARISAFESIAANPSFKHTETPPLTPRQSSSASPSPSPPNLGRKTSLIDLKDWIVDDGPSPTHTNGVKHYNDNGRTPTQLAFSAKKQLIAPLINLESPPKSRSKLSPTSAAKAPPLPPRKPSFTSLKSAAASSSNVAVPLPSRRSDSLTVDRVHTYPPLKIDDSSRSRNTSGHAPASSISSFHSVSLSSDTDPSTPGSVSNFIATFPMDHEEQKLSNGSEADSISLGESYEEVSTTSLASPATERMISLDWEKAMAKRKPVPPKLPQRPSPTSTASQNAFTTFKSPPSTPSSPGFRGSISSGSSSTIPNSTTARRPPPPPPSRSSDRSSIQSFSSNHSHSSLGHHSSAPRALNHLHPPTKRPTPVPAAARARYEAVFNVNVVQLRKAEKLKRDGKPMMLSPTEAKRTRQAAGWRGLSVDLITGGQDTPASPSAEDDVDGVVDGSEQLEGHIVKTIWRRSRLDRRRLRDIWSECDPNSLGSLNRDGFVKGMWRIDEELRRAHTHALKSTSTTSLVGKGAYKAPTQRVKPILR